MQGWLATHSFHPLVLPEMTVILSNQVQRSATHISAYSSIQYSLDINWRFPFHFPALESCGFGKEGKVQTNLPSLHKYQKG